uniref:very-long-chain (3R)-3-hydroxyacyl-CoA dehydratase n=1 Tax=Pinguiococcus pyrenoidosus TaxID=172671 RepID=A0A7R9YBW2_9STRA|mmetsp:Transcript_19149/g.72341  ORF Transcript_19149/g.72341 Transcript_19149/m.72341 type:complete len:389 (+) Transcript_19149:290-1456(+)
MGFIDMYLMCYNTAVLVCWATALAQLAYHFDYEDADCSVVAAMPYVSCAQALGLLEVFHVLLGFVRGSVPAALLQAFGRNTVWFCFCVSLRMPERMGLASPEGVHHLDELNALHPTFVLALSWSLAEMCRYPYYIVAMLGKPPAFVKWLRYSGFIILYPMGAAAEVLVVMRCLTRIAALGWFNAAWTVQGFDVPFHFQTFIHLVAPPGYLLGFPLIYMYMFKQRRKALARGPRIVQIRDSEKPEKMQLIDNLIRKSEGDMVVFIYGAIKPESTSVARPFGDSWCPDCTAAFPIVWPRLLRLPDDMLVLDIPLERSPYKGLEPFAKVHPLKEHALIELERVPTLLYFLNCGKSDGEEDNSFDRYALVEEECHVDSDVAALLSAAWKKEQ